MRFLRKPVVAVKGITPRRLSAAKRRLQRRRDSWALFPEYWPTQSAEEDILEIDRKQLEGEVVDRQQRADEWRRLRRMIRQHPRRADILRYWNACNYAGTPEYLDGLIRKVTNNLNYVSEIEQSLEHARRMGRLMQEAMHDAEAQRPGESYKDAFFRRLASARKKIESEQ
ncbi:MAG: hypothetical protein LBK76_02525 [Verrucomicrobiales bacterium]|jgi:hypothetical protein|nr:hypothetical protein [Verrucomicrobiales bacterium]